MMKFSELHLGFFRGGRHGVTGGHKEEEEATSLGRAGSKEHHGCDGELEKIWKRSNVKMIEI
jgi:hypothetical protein